MTDWLMDKMFKVIIWSCSIMFIGMIVFGVYGLYQYFICPTFSLDKNAWLCSSSHKEQTTFYYNSGGVMMPSTSISTVCDQWSKK